MDSRDKNDINKHLEELKKILYEECFNLPQGKLIRSKIGIEILNFFNIRYNSEFKKLFMIIELIHNASLMHDDVLDNETTRRGKKSINITEGNKKSILYGNLILIKAIKQIDNFDNKQLREMFYSTVENMCLGEFKQDINSNRVPTIEEYINTIKLKTANLFCAIGKSIAYSTNKKKIFEIVGFCENFGIAFQIMNDLKNYETNNTDIENGIYTAPNIFELKYKSKKISIEKTISLADNYIREAHAVVHRLGNSKNSLTLSKELECLKT